MKKTKKKVLNKKDRLKEKINVLEKELKLANEEKLEQVEYWHGKYDSLNDSLNEKFNDLESMYHKVISQYECVPNPILMENRWLKETIELITIPTDKLERLEAIRRERINREDPFSDYNRRRGY